MKQVSKVDGSSPDELSSFTEAEIYNPLASLKDLKDQCGELSAQRRKLYDRLDKTTKAFRKVIEAIDKRYPELCEDLDKEMAINEAVMKAQD